MKRIASANKTDRPGSASTVKSASSSSAVRGKTSVNNENNNEAVSSGPWSGPWKMLRYLRSLDHTDGSFEQQTFLTEPAVFDKEAMRDVSDASSSSNVAANAPPPTQKLSEQSMSL